MGWSLDVYHKKHKRQSNEDQAGIVDGQYPQRVKSQQQTNGTDDARCVPSRAGKLEQDGIDAHGQKNKGDGRVGNDVQELLDEGHRLLAHGGAVRLQGDLLVVDLNLKPVDLGQEIVQVFGDKVDDAQLQGFLGSGCPGFLDGRLGPGDRLLAPPGCQCPRLGFQVLFELLLHRLAQVFTLGSDGTGGADGRARCHGCYVPGEGDQGSCRGGVGTPGVDIDDDWHICLEDGLDDIAHQVHLSARRVQLDD